MKHVVAWYRQYGSWQWVTRGVQLFLIVGLFAAIVLVMLSTWERHAAMLASSAQQQSTSEMLVLANKICEARLDRMMGIYERAIQRYVDEEQRRGTPAPSRPGRPNNEDE